MVGVGKKLPAFSLPRSDGTLWKTSDFVSSDGKGGKLVLTCEACGVSSPLGFKYCGSCGAELQPETSQHPSGEERRIVSRWQLATAISHDWLGGSSAAWGKEPCPCTS
jgi:hypothetical protein